ncbi:MAG: MBL fold metallo-hydrolase [Clostridiales bacterium]|nr:MBL fold metallo-hydrolase [Clostridiales bacterium]
MLIRLISNAGLYIEGAGNRLIIDGLYGSAPGGFSGVPLEWEERLGDEGFRENITGVLVSHYHLDHYNVNRLKAFAKGAGDAVYVLPEDRQMVKRLPDLKDLRLIDTTKGLKTVIELAGGDKITGFAINHSGKSYRSIMVVCYIIEMDNRRILVLSDADFDPKYLGEMAGERHYDAVFCNPLFLDIPGGREAVLEVINTGLVCVYHVPFEEDDIYGIRGMAEQGKKLYNNGERKIVLFDKKDFTIEI